MADSPYRMVKATTPPNTYNITWREEKQGKKGSVAVVIPRVSQCATGMHQSMTLQNTSKLTAQQTICTPSIFSMYMSH